MEELGSERIEIREIPLDLHFVGIVKVRKVHHRYQYFHLSCQSGKMNGIVDTCKD